LAALFLGQASVLGACDRFFCASRGLSQLFGRQKAAFNKSLQRARRAAAVLANGGSAGFF